MKVLHLMNGGGSVKELDIVLELLAVSLLAEDIPF